MGIFPFFVPGLFSICQEWRVVISSHCLRLVNIDSFIGGDRDIINRRLGERRKVSLCFFSFFWFGTDPQIAVLWAWPAKFIWFYQGPLTPCSHSRLKPSTFQILHRALIHTFIHWHEDVNAASTQSCTVFSYALTHVWHTHMLCISMPSAQACMQIHYLFTVQLGNKAVQNYALTKNISRNI